MSNAALRILLVDLAQSFGGAEVRVLTQARAMQGQVEKCAVAVLSGSTLHQKLQAEGLPADVITVSRSDPRLLLQLRKIIKQGRYQIVDAHNVQSIFWGHFAAALGGAKGRVSTIHSDYGGEYPGLKGKAYEGVLWLSRPLVKHSINVTEVLQEKSEHRHQGHRSTLIHNAVPVPSEPFNGKNTQLRQEFGFTDTDFIVASIARLKPVKGQKYLVEAFSQFGDLPSAKLLIAGDGPLREELEQQIAALGIQNRVHIAGFRNDIPAILQAVDCVCMSSLSEALPYTVLEAASYARPLLVTRVGGMATLLEDGKTALLVPPQDATALADGIRRLVQHPDEARRIGVAGYELVRQSFSVETMISKILNVYEQALR